MSRSAEHRRAELRRAITQNPQLTPHCARAVAERLDRMPPGRRIVLYGRGLLARTLVEAHRDSLDRHEISFMESVAPPETSFSGFPCHGLEQFAESADEHVLVLVLSFAFRAEMLARVDFIARERVLLLPEIVEACEDHPLFEDALSELSEAVEREIATIECLCQSSRHFVCFATQQPAHHFLKTIREVRRAGCRTLLVAERAEITDDISLHSFVGEGYFDHLYVSHFSFSLELVELLRRLPIDVLHAETGMWPTRSLAYVMQHRDCAAVVEYRDFKQTVFADEEAAMKTLELSRADYRLEEDAQRAVFCLADGIVFKDSPEVITHLEQRYGHRPPRRLHFMHYPSRDFTAAPGSVTRLSDADGAPRIVYAGNVVNDPGWHNYPIFSSLLRAGRILDAQGIHLSIYNAIDSSGEGFEEYLALDDELECFHYHFAIPYSQLRDVLPQHDFGWFCFDFSAALESPFFLRTTMGSKVFSYLEAGLPILVSPEQEYIRSVVEELRIGLAVDYSQLPALGSLLERQDWSGIRRAIAEARDRHGYHEHVPRLLDFYAAAASSAATGEDAESASMRSRRDAPIAPRAERRSGASRSDVAGRAASRAGSRASPASRAGGAGSRSDRRPHRPGLERT